MSRAVRIPEETYTAVRPLAGLTGRTPGELLADAWSEYLDRHQDEFVEVFEHAKKYIASNDRNGLTELLLSNVRNRAAEAARAAVLGSDSEDESES